MWYLIAAGVFGLLFLWLFNGLVGLRQRTKDAYAGIDVQLKRRHDLVPNIVAVVKGYAAHERETLEAVTAARTAATGAEAAAGPAARGEREAGLARQLGRLLALVEQYPELKADQNFRRLHDDLVEIEDHLQYARRYYNGTVRDYNTRREQVPGNIVAAVGRFGAAEYFQFEEDDA